MTATWEVETQLIPQYFNDFKSEFLEGLLIRKTDYFCHIFNGSFRVCLLSGRLKKKIKYKPRDFFFYGRKINDTDRLIYIELPKPKRVDFSYNLYVKGYFIPYRLEDDHIEIFDLFGVDAIKGSNSGLIVRYVDGKHMISSMQLPVSTANRNDLINFMTNYIFERI